MSDDVAPHGPLRQLAPGLHVVDGEWGPLGRRMTVMATPDGRLAIHSAMRLGEAEMAKLDALGCVAWILVPNPEHSTDAPWYAQRYPDARLLVPAQGRAALEKDGLRPHGTHEADWPPELAGVIERAALDGLRLNPEVVFLHVASRTLVVCDLAFNLPAGGGGCLFRMFMRLNGALGTFGPTRFFRTMIVRDARALAASLRPVWAWDFDRIVVSHGDVREAGGKAALQAACARFGS